MRPIKDVARVVPRDPALSEGELERRVERASIEHSLANLRTFPWVRVRENTGELGLHGAWFDIAMGELHVFDEANSNWTILDHA